MKFLRLLLVLLVLSGGAYAAFEFQQTAPEDVVDEKDLYAAVKSGDVAVTIEGSGTINNTITRKIKNEIRYSGTILSWIVQEGSLVTPDTVVVRLDNENILERLDRYRERVKGQETRIDNLESSLIDEKEKYEKDMYDLQTKLTKAYQDYFNFKNNKVKEAIKKHNDSIDAAAKAIDEKKQELQKQQELLLSSDDGDKAEKISKTIAKMQREIENGLAQNLESARKAKFRYLQFELPRLEGQQLKEIPIAQKAIEDRKARYEEFVKGRDETIEYAKKEIENITEWIQNLEEQQSKLELKAGVHGLVIYGDVDRRRNNSVLEVGKPVQNSVVMISIPADSDMFVELRVDEELRPLYSVGTPAVGVIDAIKNLSLKGSVSKIGQLAMRKYQVDPNSPRIFPVRVEFPKDQPGFDKVIAGMTVKVTLLCEEHKDVLSVPVHAVYEREGNVYTRIRVGRNDWEERQVKVGRHNEVDVIVLEGVKEGEEVLLFDPMLTVNS